MAKQTFYFSHDYFARSDRKMISLTMKHGMAGIGVYWCLVEMLYEEGGFMPIELERLSFDLRCSTDLIQSVIKDFSLFDFDDEMFWSNSVIERLKLRMSKSEKARKSVMERWAKRLDDTNVIRT